MTILSLDVESRSTVDLKKTGAYPYWAHEDTGLWCACYAFDDEPVQTWRPGQPCPPRIASHVEGGGIVSAWNATFERLAWNHCLGPRHGWPVPALEQFEDTAAFAAALSLPRALGQAAKALGIAEQKDDDGARLMLQMARPRKPRKGENPEALLWWDDEDRLARLIAYCVRDVEAERAIRKILVPLSDAEKAVYHLDQRINDRGVRIDLDLVRAMLQITGAARDLLDTQLEIASSFMLAKCSEVAKMVVWLHERGVPTDSLDRNALARLLACDDIPADVRAVLELRREYAKSSTAKLEAMAHYGSVDGRARGLHLYHGASTGRWAGRGIQCVTGDHEVLTPEGWRPIRELVGPCRIMQWSRETRRMTWTEAVINQFEAPSRIAVIDNPAIRGRYTLDHRMPVVNYRGAGDWTPKKLLEVSRRDGFAIVDPVDQPDNTAFSDDMIRLLVAMQADGTWRGTRALFRFSKTRKIDRLESILRSLDMRYEKRVHRCAPRVTNITPQYAPNWLTKGFGPWVLTLSARQARVFVDELAHWDGFAHQKNGATCLMSPEKEQVEWMATAMALAGIPCSVNWYADSKSKRGRWALYAKSSTTTTIHRHQMCIMRNDEAVYCPTVPEGYWLCRYQDRIYVTGNTQNMPRGTGTVKDPEAAAADFLHGRADWIDTIHGSPMSAVSDMLRACITASEGHRLVVADFASIEGRVTAWLAGEQWKVDAFIANDEGRGPGMYELAASGIYGLPVASIGKKSMERQVGKAAELGLGFGGGVMAFDSMARVYGVDMTGAYAPLSRNADPEVWERACESYDRWLTEGALLGTGVLKREAWVASEVTKVQWRDKHPNIVALWAGLEEAAMAAVENPGEIRTYGRIAYLVRRGFLWCRLPSSRCLAYADPQIKMRKAPWGDEQPCVTAMGMDSVTNKWRRQDLYGGLLTENCVQAIARDLLANGMQVAEGRGYPIVLHIHDEAVADVPAGQGSLAEFEASLAETPDWADGLPVVAEGYEALRYRKD